MSSLGLGFLGRRPPAHDSFHLLDLAEEKQLVAHNSSTHEEQKDDPDALFQRMETVLAEEVCPPARGAHITAHVQASLLSILHLSRWLRGTRLLSHEDLAGSSPSDALEAILGVESEGMSPRAWTELFAAHPAPAWVRVLRVFCLYTELVPRRNRKVFLQVGKLMGGGRADDNMAAAEDTELRAALEDLAWNHLVALAALCALLSRDGKNRKSLSCLFGSWLLLEHQERTQGQMLDRAGRVMGSLIVHQDALFAWLVGRPVEEESRRHTQNWGSMVRSSSIKLNKSFHGTLKQLTKKGSSSEMFNTEGDEQEEEEEVEEQPPSPISLEQRERVMEDVRARPARRRDSIERIYGRPPAPPPPRSEGEETKQVTPPAPPTVLLLAEMKSLQHRQEKRKPPPLPRHLSPLLTTTAPSPMLSRAAPPPKPAQLRPEPVAVKPAFVLKPVGGVRPNHHASPANRRRAPPPIPPSLSSSSPNTGPNLVNPPLYAAQAGARRRGMSKEAI